MHARADWAMPRSAGGEKEHGVFIPDLVGVVHLAEEVGGVGELRLEFLLHFLPDGVAALSNAWSDGSDQIFWPGAKLQPHAPLSVFYDAGQRASPSGMKAGDGPLLPVGHQHRNAIRGLDTQ